MFAAKLLPLLLEVYLYSIDKQQLPTTARQSVISLLDKPGKDPLFLTSWRPLSLLNVDNKIFGKVLAERLQKVIPLLVHHSQTGFIKGRQLSENILKILKIVQTCEDEQINGFLVGYDFQKAFDYLEHPTIFCVLQKFGFGKEYIKMVENPLH